MQKSHYLNDSEVAGFIDWMAPVVAGDRQFTHAWTSKKWGDWSCSSLFDAYHGYEWRYSAIFPGDDAMTRGVSFADTKSALDRLGGLLRASADDGDATLFLSAAEAVVGWGGVRQNVAKMRHAGTNLMPSVLNAASQLDPSTADLERLDAVEHMNSGFSKLFSLLLTDFPIYDSRVACSLASFVYRYCEEADRLEIPSTLAFGIPPSRGPLRNPSSETLRFPRLWHGNPRAYARSNLMAAWLIRELAEHGPFGDLAASERLLALQSAFFMTGYVVLGPNSIAPS